MAFGKIVGGTVSTRQEFAISSGSLIVSKLTDEGLLGIRFLIGPGKNGGKRILANMVVHKLENRFSSNLTFQE